MLSSRTLEDGVEVIAAIDYDDGLVSEYARVAAGVTARTEADSMRRAEAGIAEHADAKPTERAEAGAAEDAEAGAIERPRRMPAATATAAVAAARSKVSTAPPPRAVRQSTAAPAARRAAARPPAPASGRVAAELNDLRQLLEAQLASLAWNDVNRRHPAYARSLRQLAKVGIDPDLAKKLAAELPQGARRELADLPGIVAVVGPTGVGKTTAIAKIAARFVMRYGVRKLGLISADCFRIGAREQLMTFARILGTPMQVAANADELRDVLDEMRHKRLVLIDTAGMGQRDVRLAAQFATLKVAPYRIRTVLALSAAADRGVLNEAFAAFQPARPSALIATKLDEATSLGPVLSLVLQSSLPLAYIADGQRVPEDLHLAGRKRAWLIQRAMRLAGEHTRDQDEETLAYQYADRGLAANG
jgi:flagellar biosynthesis protein FlhF